MDIKPSEIRFVDSVSSQLHTNFPPMETWKDRARVRMKALGVTQELLAEQFGMTPAAIQKWLAGARQPSLDDINQIADVLKVPRVWLTHGILPDFTLDGLAPAAQHALSQLIQKERQSQMPDSFWTGLIAMADAIQNPTLSGRSTGAARSGTEG